MRFTMNLEFLGFPDYEVDEDGNVYSHLSKRNLKWSISPQHHDKYAKVMLTKADKSGTKFITVHRLVAYSFLPKPFGKNYVNHIDGNIHNNCVSNLEWVTALENNLHSIDKVRKPQFLITDIDLPERGDYKDRGKGRELTFSEEEAIQYCEYMMQGYRACDLRVMMNIAGKIYTTFKFHRDHKYKYIADRYDFSHLPSPKPKLEDSVVLEICKRLEARETVMSIYKSLGLSRTTVRGIKDRRSYKHISKNFVW